MKYALGGVDQQRVQSSPGNLQVGQVPSNWTRQIPQTSSSGISHRHVATACQDLILTFILTELDTKGGVRTLKAAQAPREVFVE